MKKRAKNRCKFTVGNRRDKKALKNWICEGLGLYFGGVGRGLGRVLEPLGVSWAVFCTHFFMFVFGVVVKSALGGVWAGFWFDFKGFGKDLGRILEGFSEDFERTFEVFCKVWGDKQ